MSQGSLIARIRQYFTNDSLPPDLKLSKDAVVSLTIHAFFQFGASMSGLFLNLYLWRLTGDFTINAVYNMINFAITPIAFAIGGLIAKKHDRMVVYRLGISFFAVFYLLVILTGEAVPQYYIIFALLNGIAGGFYWTGYLVLQYDVSTERNRIRYLAINTITFNLAGLAGPALAGLIIHQMDGLQGYILIFVFAFLMFVLAAIISMKIKATINHHRTYYLKYVGIVMKKHLNWTAGLFSFLFLGLFQGVMLFLPNIMLFRALDREDWVGYFLVLFSAITVVMGYIISKTAKEEYIRKYIFFSTCGVVIGAFLLLIEVKLWSVVIFMIIYSICTPLITNSLTSHFYRSITALPLKGQLKVEAVVMRELFLNIGRVCAIILLIVFASDLDSIWLPIIIILMATAQFLILVCIRKESNKVVPISSSSKRSL